MRGWLTSAFIGFASLGSGTLAAAAAPAAAASPAAMELGYELASVTNSEALTKLQFEKLLNDTLPKQLAANADFVELEARFPGISDKIIAAMRPVMIAEILPTLPKLWQRLAPIYAGHLSEAEMKSCLGFYRSPVGLRLIDIMGRGSDFSRVMQDSLQSAGEGKVTTEALKSGVNIGIQRVNQQLTADEIEEVRRFETGPIGPKLAVINPKLQEVAADWANEPTPELDAKIAAAMMAAIKPYLDGAAK